jgi:hypothetical protein
MHNARVMATPKPGEIRCPTCHRSTPPATFCTQCGSAIPPDARIRPRGMDRDELQGRIRARRSGDPYRRGGIADDEFPGYERYEPEPEDNRARPSREARESHRDHFDERAAGAGFGAAAAPEVAEATRDEPVRRDVTRDDDDWAPTGAAAVPPPATVPPAEGPTRTDRFDDAAYDDAYAYDAEYDTWEDDDQRRGSGAGAFAILGFLALGFLALLGGAALAGVFGGDPGVGQGPTATPVATVEATELPSPDATTDPSPEPSPDETSAPPDDGEPVVFPDGFVAEAQPCLPGSAGTSGCDSNAETNSGSLWVWVGFRNGTQNDVIGAELIGPDGNTVGEGSIDLERIGCRPTCPGGWTYFPFSNLPPGEYEVEITRNGQPAGTTRFEVI